MCDVTRAIDAFQGYVSAAEAAAAAALPPMSTFRSPFKNNNSSTPDQKLLAVSSLFFCSPLLWCVTLKNNTSRTSLSHFIHLISPKNLEYVSNSWPKTIGGGVSKNGLDVDLNILHSRTSCFKLAVVQSLLRFLVLHIFG